MLKIRTRSTALGRAASQTAHKQLVATDKASFEQQIFLEFVATVIVAVSSLAPCLNL